MLQVASQYSPCTTPGVCRTSVLKEAVESSLANDMSAVLWLAAAARAGRVLLFCCADVRVGWFLV